MSLKRIIHKLRAFTHERDWEKFHTPKDLAIASSLEANELLEHFVWKSAAEAEKYAQENKAEIGKEIADVAIYLMLLADKLGLDLLKIVDQKITENGEKYPVAKARGSAKKYTEYLDR